MSQRGRILLGISGGIAAYKSLELIRLLRGAGYEVRCAVTRAAVSFVSPLSLEVLSGQPVYREEYLGANGSGEELHITAAAWADVICVAPATAHTLGKLALGLADDFLSTTVMAFSGPLVVAPAMHSVMWHQEAVGSNVDRLRQRGVTVLGPAQGALASGETGIGRMVEPNEILDALRCLLTADTLAGRTVLVTAGPTREPLDPVRYLSNRSSGKMGFAIASAAAARGARTLLVSGPVQQPTPAGVERIDVVTAEEMREAVFSRAAGADLVVMTAAVSDFRPRRTLGHKIKKREGISSIELALNPDILAGLPAVAPETILVGFAAETEDIERQARLKLREKGVDFIVANDVSRPEVGFESDDNEVVVYRPSGDPIAFEKQSKRQLAGRLIELFTEAISRERSQQEPAPVDS